ncbi:hypothetical protein NPIL_527501 [Nephila pilipes]|uniref:Uncharacterized protein n=1 Tax=Nephila pilipes TaxID=299642 RepID=A0A8X6IMI4_NEPPI|nr:hypothetical protein NPIL_527501 [Nephila pilipes]
MASENPSGSIFHKISRPTRFKLKQTKSSLPPSSHVAMSSLSSNYNQNTSSSSGQRNSRILGSDSFSPAISQIFTAKSIPPGLQDSTVTQPQ